MKQKGIVLVVSFLVGLSSDSLALSHNHSPQDVVQAWMRRYGQYTFRAALLTTDSFRQGVYCKEWAKETDRILQKINYKRLDGEIVGEIISGKTARVAVEAYITVFVGVVVQRELYHMRLINGRWLIDALEVLNERYVVKEGL